MSVTAASGSGKSECGRVVRCCVAIQLVCCRVAATSQRFDFAVVMCPAHQPDLVASSLTYCTVSLLYNYPRSSVKSQQPPLMLVVCRTSSQVDSDRQSKYGTTDDS